MDEQTGVLIAVGAAVAANCVWCFRHYQAEALRVGLSPSEIDAAVALASKVKMGAVILLYDIMGLSQQEIAGVLGIEAGAVKVRLHRARRSPRRPRVGAQLHAPRPERVSLQTEAASMSAAPPAAFANGTAAVA